MRRPACFGELPPGNIEGLRGVRASRREEAVPTLFLVDRAGLPDIPDPNCKDISGARANLFGRGRLPNLAALSPLWAIPGKILRSR